MKNTIGTVAADSKDQLSGIFAMAYSLTVSFRLKHAEPYPITLSPTLKSFTPQPTAKITPENSSPRYGPEKPFSRASSGTSPIVSIISLKLRPVTLTSTNTSSDSGAVIVLTFQHKFLNLPGVEKSRYVVSKTSL